MDLFPLVLSLTPLYQKRMLGKSDKKIKTTNIPPFLSQGEREMITGVLLISQKFFIQTITQNT